MVWTVVSRRRSEKSEFMKSVKSRLTVSQVVLTLPSLYFIIVFVVGEKLI